MNDVVWHITHVSADSDGDGLRMVELARADGAGAFVVVCETWMPGRPAEAEVCGAWPVGDALGEQAAEELRGLSRMQLGERVYGWLIAQRQKREAA
jgi:hypothetical protein